MQEEIERTNTLIEEEVYKVMPILKLEMDLHCWMQVLATIDVSVMSQHTKFCDEFGISLYS